MENTPIRILQRPCPVSNKKPPEPNRPPVTVKSLEQREADYAAARRRIMGSDFDGPGITASNGSTVGNGTNGNMFSQPSSTSGVTTSATPLMSIQAAPASTSSLNSDFSGSMKVSNGPQAHGNQATRQGPATVVVNVADKLQRPKSTLNGTRPVVMLVPQQQERRMLTSSSSPSMFPYSSRANQQPLPLFQSGNSNVGLLPNPPGFNYSAQNAALNTSFHSQSAALSLMHQFSTLQQQYKHTLTGLQNSLISPVVSNATASMHHQNFSSMNFQSTTANNLRHAHPPSFN